MNLKDRLLIGTFLFLIGSPSFVVWYCSYTSEVVRDYQNKVFYCADLNGDGRISGHDEKFAELSFRQKYLKELSEREMIQNLKDDGRF